MSRKLPAAMEDIERRAAGTNFTNPVYPCQHQLDGGGTCKKCGKYFGKQEAVKMATTSGPQWVERKAPVLFEFKAPGDCVEGLLQSVGAVEIEDKQTHQKKRVIQLMIRGAGGQIFKLIATYDISQKLTQQDVGSLVEITYAGENKEVRKGDNYMREFRVRLAPRFNRNDGPEITDEDIPF